MQSDHATADFFENLALYQQNLADYRMDFNKLPETLKAVLAKCAYMVPKPT